MANKFRLNMLAPSLDGRPTYSVPFRYNNGITQRTAIEARSPLRIVSWHLVIATVIVEFTVSSNLLTAVGTSYVTEGGNLVEKVHPGSYLAILSALCRVAGMLHGPRHAWWLERRQRPLIIFVCGISFCCVYALACTGSGGVIALIDTFLPAGMVALAIGDFPADRLRQLRVLIQTLLTLNAVVALIEAVVQGHLVPVSLSGGDTAGEFRPTGLYDHPLTGAAATMMGLFLRPDAGRSRVTNFAYVALMIAALLTFGERAPLALALAALGVCHVGTLTAKLLRRACRWNDSAPILGAALAGALIIGTAAGGGFSSRLAAHLYWDSSAQVRMSEFAILSQLTLPELIFGCQRADLLAMIEPLRLSDSVGALENFWLVMLTTLGAVCFPVFVVSLLGLLHWLWRRAACSGRMMIVTLILAASTSNSLGRKSTLLVTLVACVLATGRPVRISA